MAKDFMKPSVYGVGYLGRGGYAVRLDGKLTTAYTAWRNMLKRCYTDCETKRSTAYIDCTVCSEWHNFQNFAEWHTLNYVSGFHLDKDLLSTTEKQYSPRTCAYVPNIVNTVTAIRSSLSDSGYHGVSYIKETGKYRAQMTRYGKGYNLGAFDEASEASEMYVFEKEKYVKQVAEECLDSCSISFSIYEALLDWRVYG